MSSLIVRRFKKKDQISIKQKWKVNIKNTQVVQFQKEKSSIIW
jgi:hypothetical protein